MVGPALECAADVADVVDVAVIVAMEHAMPAQQAEAVVMGPGLSIVVGLC